MTQYNESFKLAIVQEYLSSPLGYKALADKHSVDGATIRKWVSAYQEHGQAGLRKKSSHYSAQFKRSVLERMRRETAWIMRRWKASSERSNLNFFT